MMLSCLIYKIFRNSKNRKISIEKIPTFSKVSNLKRFINLKTSKYPKI
jgi:hypothetical protein